MRFVRIMLLTAVWLTCGGQRRPPEHQMTSGQEDNICPTGQSCGSSAPYCRDETTTGTTRARLIKSLPYRVLSSGKYYLDKDLTSPTIGIAVLADDVSINLNGHSITYGSATLGKGASPIGEYGILICNTGNLLSEQLDSSYSSNGFCKAGGVSARNVTIERGSLIQSPNASQYYDPLNCPGSGVGNGCSHHHESSASDVINAQYTSGITLRHLTLTWQNVDSDGAHLAWQLAGQGHKIECNTFHDKVTQINVRAYQRGIPINGTNARQADHPDSIRYNTLIGSPQSGMVAQAPGTVIEHNDINQGYYQFPPFTPKGKMYSNDYAIGACAKGGTVAYNYVHSVSGRGVGCIFAGDMGGMKIHHNFVKLIELDANGEYGPNGEKPGASWVGGCEINGGRGFESKESPNIQIYNNTFILSAGQCGAAGIVFVGFPCREVGCPASLDPFVVRDNTIQLENVAGVKKQPYAQAFACFLLNGSQGNYDNYFSPIAGNKCITDGDFVTTEGYGPGNHFVFQNDLFSRGEHPLSSGCGGSPESPCGFLMHWHGQQEPTPDELGFVFRDMTFSNDATSSFFGDGGTPLARSASVEWTYSVAVARSDDAAPVRSATVSVVDSHGRDAKCVTDGAGKCSVILAQTYISSEAGNASLREENRNPQKVTITADGCRSLTYEFESKSSFEERELLDCSAPPHP